MAAYQPELLTPSAVKKAGRVFRHLLTGQKPPAEQVMKAYQVLLAFRAAHQKPLVKANNGLRSMVKTEGCQVEVSQRLKRMPTILDKLVREPQLPLHKMQDIGGCRAVLNSIDEIRRVEARLKRARPPVGYSDYIENPRKSGYRGVHVVVLYDERRIEVQLRTRAMHAWAITVETLSSRVRENLKGDGEHAVQRLMAAISQAMALEEQGDVVDSSLIDQISVLRTAAQPYLGGAR